MSSSASDDRKVSWRELSFETRDLLAGKLNTLWGAKSDADAFDRLSVDKQQALLLLLKRLSTKSVWQTVQKIDNVYGLGGVGMAFMAWPMIHSTLSRRSDFTRFFANHRRTSGGFYEKQRAQAALHFIFEEGNPRRWYVHFDLHSPVHSFASLSRHLQVEILGRVKPDWKMIRECLKQ